MSDQPERAAGSSRCSRCGERRGADQIHVCPETSTAEGILPTLEPENRPVGVDTPVQVKVSVRPETGEDLVGQVIGERYRIERLIGHGGMGVVYQARHVVLDKLFAVKLLLTPQNAEYRRRFLQEAKLASQISHPNTVFLSDFGVLADGRSYLVMELLRGTTLSQLLTRGRLEPLRACQIAAQIARGLSAVHDQGVIHRDLKPENVFLLDPTGQEGSRDFVKIVDFGIAKQAADGAPSRPDSPSNGIVISASGQELRRSPHTLPGTLLGTPGYMSPEQARGLAADFRVDQYSLGCILFEMLSSTLPYDDDTVGGLLRKHVEEAPPSLRQRFPHLQVSAALDGLVIRLLAKRPVDRFRSMREVAEALDREIELLLVERGDHRSAPSQSALSRFSRTLTGVQTRQNPTQRIPAWAVLLFGAVVLGSLAWLAGRLFPGDKGPSGGIAAEELAELRERAIVVLQDGLRADPPELRSGALRALWRTRDPALRAQLEARLDDPNAAVEAEAAEALGQLGLRDAEVRLQTLLERPVSGPVRVAAASALMRLGSAAGQRTLEQALIDGDNPTRLAAALSLCESAQPVALPTLRSLLARITAPPEAAARALACLAQLGEPMARRSLHDHLTGATPDSLHAAAALWSLGEMRGQTYLQELVNQDGPLRIAAARQLAGPWSPGLGELFRRVALDRSALPGERELAVTGLGAQGDPNQARPLGLLLAAEPAGLRQAAAAAIIDLAPADSATLTAHSLSWARSTLDAAPLPLRISAARVLGEIPAPEAVLLLLSTLGEREVALRRAAVQALGRRPERATLWALLHALSDDDAGVRLMALRALTAVATRLQERGGAPRIAPLVALLQRLQNSGTPIEQLLATSALYHLGDSRERDRLRTLATAADPELRALVLQQLPSDTPLLLGALNDTSPWVQRLAAQRLATFGDRRAVPVLRAELQEGGPQADLAYSLLQRLGEKASLPVASDQLIASLSSEQRLNIVEAVRGFPAVIGLPVLYRAARDLDPSVRQCAAEVAADLPRATHGPEGAALLRTLLLDRDLAVWTQARALLARAYAAPGEPVEPTLPSNIEPKVAGSRLSADSLTDYDPRETTVAGEGTLVIEAPSGVYFQIDRRGWQTVQPAPLRLRSGPHTVVSLAETQEILISDGATTTVKIRESEVEQFLQAGLTAKRKDDLRAAQRQLERARALCEHDRLHEVPCHTLAFIASYHLGMLFESDKEYGRAMADFRRAAALSRRVKAHADLKTELDGAIRRLSTRVGEVQVGTMVAGHCRRTTFWLDPGVHSLDVGSGRFQNVTVRAGQTLDAGGCR